jgi:hypothetical protein
MIPLDNHDRDIGRAKASYICPLIAWCSQFVINAAVVSGGRFRGAWIAFLLAALGQFILIAAGLVLGIMVLTKEKTTVSPASRKAALIGILFSGGTLALIALLFATSLF